MEMNDKGYLELMKSECEKDVGKRHFWESIGIISGDDYYEYFLVWQCSQCRYCVKEELYFLD